MTGINLVHVRSVRIQRPGKRVRYAIHHDALDAPATATIKSSQMDRQYRIGT
jgi:hypothetical protein